MKYFKFFSVKLTSFVLLISLLGANQALAVIPSPPKLAAKSYLLIDADTGEVLVEENADEKLPPASLTKMMTAYIAEAEIASGNLQLNETVIVSEKAWQMKGSLMFIEVGEQVSVEDLLKGIIIVSGNDASVAMAEHIAGSEESFADVMNATAVKLGMTNTHFVNATGWPAENHYTTARDLAKLAKAIVYDYPERYGVYSEKYFQYGVDKRTGKPLKRQANRNALLWRDSSVDGLKTGYTKEAGYCLVTSAKKENQRLISVVMGTKSSKARAAESQKLLTYGFRFFENVKVKSAGASLEKVSVWKGDANRVSVGVAEDLMVTIPRGESKALKAEMEVNSVIEAPLEQGQPLGAVKVSLNDQLIREVPLVALESVAEAGFFKKLWDQLRLFFYQLFTE
ncbi:D-alanyl-D-alanine carboxypeptidase [Spartinivicinus sp. A2-2]|uniref:serine-type D-Ala-D-Ala carboxypeptidase n=1 Tax=Spartinivicinus poritis TaxID=2994640 RepID=A0ABT5U674_9GAMM|nr:D-alanyl-D-alanine carboxypeptidase family protein [Spartinivicinus sp. A2-2]MDE1461857.1 D-alanyl-D-alanine carboxypeptidase [Spartinivicinus sp. A2-2]